MWLEKYRLFYVALTLCFTVSFVGRWLNESFGLGLRYQKLWFGSGLGGGGCQGEGKANLYLWLLDSLCILLHSDASLLLSAAFRAEHLKTQTATTVSNYPELFCLSAERHVFPFALSGRILLVCNELDLHRSGTQWVSDTVEKH